MFESEEIQRLIEQGLSGAQVSVDGDGHHFEAVITTPAFSGKSKLQRHQMVYATLGKLMGNEIHALSLKTLAPGE